MTRSKQGDATATALVAQLSVSATLTTLHSKEVRLDHGGNFGGNVKKAASPFSPGTSLCHLPYLQLGLR